jgi:putative DNA primase/helicase
MDDRNATLLDLARVTSVEPDPALAALLDRDKRGNVLSSLLNLVRIIDLDPAFTGRLAWDEFRRRTTVDGVPVTDPVETELHVAISETWGLRTCTSLISEACRHVGQKHPHHPIRAWLSSLVWDQQPRATAWLRDHLGAPDTPYIHEVSLRFLISAVARVFHPGCKVDTVPVLHGAQGIGKSQALAALAGREWFSDSPIDFGSKDAFQGLPGVWFYEIAELDSIRRSENSAVKAFLSAQSDHYRPSFGRNVVDVPRQTVFVGTTNEPEFLRDPTGSRRFWPVPVTFADLAGLAADRDQLWAEAVHWFQQGVPWWLSDEAEAGRLEASERFREVDAWEEPIRLWTARQTGPFTVAEVLQGALGKDTAYQERKDTMRVASILANLGFEKRRSRIGADRPMMWSRSSPSEGGW